MEIGNILIKAKLIKSFVIQTRKVQSDVDKSITILAPLNLMLMKNDLLWLLYITDYNPGNHQIKKI